jgi:ribosomal peptide maturation radical SAM protein 1
MSHVLFVVMPFAGLEAPQLGVSLLKGQLRSRGIPASIVYLNFPFAEATGYNAYASMKGQSPLAGEWMFGRSLFQRSSSDDEAYFNHVREKCSCSSEFLDSVWQMATIVKPFLAYCLRAVDWERYSIIGFTSTFEQNLACLALAKLVKERFPDKIVVMGGSNCADVMGVQLHKSFPFLDYVFTGEADFSFPELVTRLASGSTGCNDIPGHVRREGTASVAVPQTSLVDAMDSLSYPDFDDYFATLRMSTLRSDFIPILQMETARGCWWGVKHHCTFCGLNPNGMDYRAKNPARAMDELMHLVSRYGTTSVFVVDNIISMDYFRSFLPELKRRNMGIKLFYETKANLTKEQVELFADAGVSAIQPGIESFSANVLNLMRKGISPLQNVQVLKWCRQYGVHPMWNIIYGFPGECEADYQEMCDIAENLSHLMPPVFCVPVCIERFSPYFNFPSDFGIRDLRADSLYRHVYPFDESVLYNIAYSFEGEFEGKDKIDSFAERIKNLIEHWKGDHARSLLEVVSRTQNSMEIQDTRPNRVHAHYRFGAPETAAIDGCERIQTLSQIMQGMRQRLNGSMPTEVWTKDFLRYLTDCRLVLERDGRYLNLILSQPRAAAEPADCAVR